MNLKSKLLCLTATAVTLLGSLPSYANCGEEGCEGSACQAKKSTADTKRCSKSKLRGKRARTRRSDAASTDSEQPAEGQVKTPAN